MLRGLCLQDWLHKERQIFKYIKVENSYRNIPKVPHRAMNDNTENDGVIIFSIPQSGYITCTILNT